MTIRSPFARPDGLQTAFHVLSREGKLYITVRILLFLATNLAVLVIASTILKLLGADHFTDQNYGGLLVFCTVSGFAGSLVSSSISKWMVKMSTGAEVISQPRTHHEQRLLQTVEELFREAGIGMSEAGIFPAYEVNAFATDWNKNDALVAVSQNLLERFSSDKVEAVLTHEIDHAASGDMVILASIQGVTNTFAMFFVRIFSSLVDKAILKNEDGPGIGYFVATIFTEPVPGTLVSITVMQFSYRREFRADAAGVHLAGTGATIAALQRLRSEQGVPVQISDTLDAFGINGGFKYDLVDLLMSHPSLEDHIEALRVSVR